jgi:ribonuclease BN (tRNA processing enzyme)
MKIKLLGTRGEIEEQAPWHTKHSGILIDDRVLIDLGEEEYLNYNPSFVVFTHLHPDHAFFVRKNNKLKPEIDAYAPETSEQIETLQVVTGPFEKNGYKFTPIPVIHSLKVKSLAYIVEKGDKRLLYTGDVAWIEKKAREKLGKLDMVITEGSFIKKGGMIRRDKNTGKIFGHTGIPDLIKMFSPHAQHIVLTHFGSWFIKDVEEGRKKIRELAPSNIQVEAARDGQEFIL